MYFTGGITVELHNNNTLPVAVVVIEFPSGREMAKAVSDNHFTFTATEEGIYIFKCMHNNYIVKSLSINVTEQKHPLYYITGESIPLDTIVFDNAIPVSTYYDYYIEYPDGYRSYNNDRINNSITIEAFNLTISDRVIPGIVKIVFTFAANANATPFNDTDIVYHTEIINIVERDTIVDINL